MASLNTYANPKSEKMICSYFRAKGFEEELRRYGGTDKFMHCTMSCYLAARCGTSESAIAGILKEIIDVFGPGNAELADLKANAKGISFGSSLFYSGQNGEYKKKFCIRKCEKVYP